MDTREIGGVTYSLVRHQKSGTNVYRAHDTYLRIGDKAAIEKQLHAHRHLEERNFPVAHVIETGESHGDLYFIETSLGEMRYLEIFEKDTAEYGAITDPHFAEFMDVVERFLRAQMRSHMTRDESRFGTALHLQNLKSELPQYADRIQARFEESMTRLSAHPFVTTHGDFNPANIYPNGVIDFEDSTCGPLGYDIACVTSTVEWFPPNGDYEFIARYQFKDSQKETYLQKFDEILREEHVPSLTSTLSDFEFLRAIWLSVRMEKWPKLQQYRYDLFIKKYLA